MDKVVGCWKGFEFKAIEDADKPKILKHLREFAYYSSLKLLGFEKDNQIMLDDHEQMFLTFLNDRYNLCFYAEDKKSGKVIFKRIMPGESVY